jgi:hypothetical protein
MHTQTLNYGVLPPPYAQALDRVFWGPFAVEAYTGPRFKDDPFKNSDNILEIRFSETMLRGESIFGPDVPWGLAVICSSWCP